MNVGRDALTYFVGLLTMAIVLTNADHVSQLIVAISRGARSVSSIFFTGGTRTNGGVVSV